jgi:hypothetical protein
MSLMFLTGEGHRRTEVPAWFMTLNLYIATPTLLHPECLCRW